MNDKVEIVLNVPDGFREGLMVILTGVLAGQIAACVAFGIFLWWTREKS